MVLPPNANVYYAINTSCDLNFVLRPKSDSSLSSAQSSPGSASIGPIVGRSSGASSGTPGRPRLRDASGTKEGLKARKKILSLGLWTNFSNQWNSVFFSSLLNYRNFFAWHIIQCDTIFFFFFYKLFYMCCPYFILSQSKPHVSTFFGVIITK